MVSAADPILKALLTGKSLDIPAVVAALPTEGALDALERAARGSKRRAEHRLVVLVALGETPGPLAEGADAQVRSVLHRPRAEGRDPLLQHLKYRPASRRFCVDLCTLAADRSDPDWAWAVDALGVLAPVGDAAASAVLLQMTAGLDTPFVLVNALVRLRPPAAAPLFEALRRHPEPRTVTYALWGLAALGETDAIRALIDRLDDGDVHTPNAYTPGQDRRAAQALCDVFGWPFEWAPEAVEATRARLAAQRG